MTSNKKALHLTSLIFAILICFSILTPIAPAYALNSTVSSANDSNPPVCYSSSYINSYTTAAAAGSGGIINFAYSITGTGIMDQIGVTELVIYENGVAIKTYTSGMMAYNTNSYTGYFTYQGTIGKSYSGFVCFQCGKGGAWDNRSMDTVTVVAKN